jgi:tetratricopeptide (TPR) repeat protein
MSTTLRRGAALAWVALAGPRAVAAELDEAWALLEAGEHAEAQRAFEARLASSPDDVHAWAGVAWACLSTADLDCAQGAIDGIAASQRTLDDFDTLRLLVLRADRAHRDEALAAYRAWLEDHPDDHATRLHYAQLLSWDPKDLALADEELQRVLEQQPRDRQATFDRIEVLRWLERPVDARALLDRWIATFPEDQDARRRLEGLPASPHTPTPLPEPPPEPTPAPEPIQSSAVAGEATATPEAATPSPEPTEPRPTLKISETWGYESSGFHRNTLRLREAWTIGSDTAVEIGPSWTYFYDDSLIMHRASLGGRVVRQLPAAFELRLDYLLHLQRDTAPSHQLEGLLAWGPAVSPLGLSLGGRQRDLADLPCQLHDIGLFSIIGAGGLTVPALRDGFQVRELVAGLDLVPLRGLFAYSSGTLGSFSDGNRNKTLSAGLGYDLSTLVARPSAHHLTLRYGLWAADYDAPSVDYWAPQGFLVHLPALEWAYRPSDDFAARVEAGPAVKASGAVDPNLGAHIAWLSPTGTQVETGLVLSGSGEWRTVAAKLHLGAPQ